MSPLGSPKKAKLAAPQVSAIKQALLAGAAPAHLAARFGLHISSIYNIINGRCWGGIHVAGWHPDNLQSRSRKLTAAQVADMRRQYRTGNVTFNNLAARYQVSVATARRAVKRINYRWA